MSDTSSIPGLRELWQLTLGDPAITVAVLDGPAVLDHPCLREANVRRLRSYWYQEGAEVDDGVVEHATHVCSVLFSPHDTEVKGLAPHCRGLSIAVQPVENITDTMSLVRALDAARDAGAHIIHAAVVQPTQSGTAEYMLERAVRACLDEGILIVSPAGNDKGECWTMPSAIPGVLAVGAMKDDGQPFTFSNYGGILESQGVLAPGENILGADPQGGTWQKKGTSCAAPIVTGVAALLMSLQRQQRQQLSAAEVRQAILDSAIPCRSQEIEKPERCLRGKLNIAGATAIIRGQVSSFGTIRPTIAMASPKPKALEPRPGLLASMAAGQPDTRGEPAALNKSGRANLIYALGTIGYDFGTEARRDTFRQRMPPVPKGTTMVPADPYEPRQMSAYLADQPDEARALLWVLYQEQRPVYALKPVGSFGHYIYERFRLLLAGQEEAEGNTRHIERVSLPGELTARTLRLLSGQEVPLVKLRVPRGLYGWQVDAQIDQALAAAAPDFEKNSVPRLHRALRSFLDHIFHELRNTGRLAKDRALNFAATNAFQAAEAFAAALAEGRQLKNLEVVKSPICRLNSECWDVKLKFFDPNYGQRAKRICRFTIDVSDPFPVTVGEVRYWLTLD